MNLLRRKILDSKLFRIRFHDSQKESFEIFRRPRDSIGVPSPDPDECSEIVPARSDGESKLDPYFQIALRGGINCQLQRMSCSPDRKAEMTGIQAPFSRRQAGLVLVDDEVVRFPEPILEQDGNEHQDNETRNELWLANY